jgi:hypothetical protein
MNVVLDQTVDMKTKTDIGMVVSLFAPAVVRKPTRDLGSAALACVHNTWVWLQLMGRSPAGQ